MSALAENMSAKDIAQIINQAVDMQIQAKLDAAHFDTTVQGVIVQVVNEADGRYLVEIQNSKFDAYSANTKYSEGEHVYINIPENDYSKQKFIIGRVTDTGSGAFIMRYPFDNFVKLSDLFNNSNQTEFIASETEYLLDNGNKIYIYNDGYHANKPEDGCDIEADTDGHNLIWYWSRHDMTMLGSTLGIAIDWQTVFNDLMASGDYGLHILVQGKTIADEAEETQQEITRSYYFTTKDMYGNVYGFTTPYTQQILLNVSDFSAIEHIAVYFWQDHNFYNESNEFLPYANNEPANLLCANLQVFLGYRADELQEETMKIFTYNSLIYGTNTASNISRSILDKKDLHAAWIHQITDGEKTSYMVIQDTESRLRFNSTLAAVEDHAHIYWFKQCSNQQERLDIASQYKDSPLQRILDYAGFDYVLMPEYDDRFDIDYVMDITTSKQRFKVCVVWSDGYVVSNAIVFTNENRNIESDISMSTKDVVFRLLREETYIDNKKQKHTRLVEDNNIGSFLVYDENNNILKNDEQVYYSDIWYYIQVWMYDHTNDKYLPLIVGEDDAESGYSVTWSFPTSKTMIDTMSEIDLTDMKYMSELVPSSTNAFSQVQKITRKFQIKDFWEVKNNNNTISARVIRNGKTYYLQQKLEFGQSGATGTPFTLRMNIINSDSYALIRNEFFYIETVVYGQDGKKWESSAFEFKYELLNDGPCKIFTNLSPHNVTASNWNQLSTDGYTNNAISGFLCTDKPPLFKVKVNLHDPQYDYEIEYIKGFMSVSNQNVINTYAIDCPNRVEYKSDGTTPIFDSSEFSVVELATDHYLYPEWVLEQYQKNLMGVKSLVLPSQLKYVHLDEIDNNNVPYNTNTANDEHRAEQEQQDVEYKTYKLNPYLDNYGKIKDQIAFFWDDEMESDANTFLGCYIGDAVVWQALAFAHNTYASSLINSWDGQLLMDKEKNAILARMIGAGTKDTRNRFTGVIMGDWHEYGDESIDPVGLYGFNHGVQTYSFKTDGTGFIGAAGRGQIKFDGNQALISDYSKDHYINLNPINYSINYGSGEVNYESGSYSQYFLFARNDKLQNLIEDTYGFINTAWADQFKNDTNHDYFVVDPNNGVYMSGGLIARYGRIGDYLQLSSSGISYSKDDGIIFIGQERTRDGQLIPDGAARIYDNVYWDDNKDIETHFDFTGSDAIGRYIFWAGDLKNNGEINDHPNFGIEHNGTVHLNHAYVEGEIHASALYIGFDDGEYHDIHERFATTYYLPVNPALLEDDGGICHYHYGDMLFKGDLWYDTSTQVNVDNLDEYQVNVLDLEDNLAGADGHLINAWDETIVITQDDVTTTTTGSGIKYSKENKNKTMTKGYRVSTWLGNTYDSMPSNTTWNGTTPPAGWLTQPGVSADLLSYLDQYTSSLDNTLSTLQSEIIKAVDMGYNQIRRGMTPLSFYEDGNCYIAITQTQGVVPNIGSVPAGITIYQLDKNNKFDGGSFMLNGKRMGFFKSVKVNDTYYSLPMLSYVNGNLGLAGSLFLGLDVTKTLDDNDRDITDWEKNSLYLSYLDGPNAKLSIGNEHIVLDAGIIRDSSTNKVSEYHPRVIIKNERISRTNKIDKYGWWTSFDWDKYQTGYIYSQLDPNHNDEHNFNDPGTTELDLNGNRLPKYDYFIADPTNGLYFSGGFQAQYGKIGDYLQITPSGLIYKDTTTNASYVMYFGQQRTRDGAIITDWAGLTGNDSQGHTTEGYDDDLWEKDTDMSTKATKGRYVLWIGPATGNNIYPSFGVEHNGTAHLNNAHVRGDIMAKSLTIFNEQTKTFLPTGTARTFYSKYNPAMLESDEENPGNCKSTYGDSLIPGDVWYFIGKTETVEIKQYGERTSADTYAAGEYDINDPNETEYLSTPASIDEGETKKHTKNVYMMATWVGKDTPYDSIPENNEWKKEEDGSYTPPEGWAKQPEYTGDLLSWMQTYTGDLDTRIKQLQYFTENTIKEGYNALRSGMSPISFYQDGNCYVSVSHESRNIKGIGSVPPGIAIYQLKKNSNQWNGSAFYLNGMRMGFYRKKLDSDSISPAAGTDIDIPLLTYYNGNMALAGGLLLGLDFNNAWHDQLDTETNDVNLYANYFDGYNAKLSIGNGHIVLDAGITRDNTYKVTAYNPTIFIYNPTVALKTDNTYDETYGIYCNVSPTLPAWVRNKIAPYEGVTGEAIDNLTYDNLINDYIYMDPEYGAFFSGGIRARYGRIGNSLQLTDSGLVYFRASREYYNEESLTTEKKYGIMYLGQERTRSGMLVKATQTTLPYDSIYVKAEDDTNNANSKGRYIIWVGEGHDNGRPLYSYPKFGVESDGTAHLQNAFVEGEIYASSLYIKMPNGKDRNTYDRFARTYYSSINPAIVKNNSNTGGICIEEYGDMLLEGDLWYDTSISQSINDINTLEININTNTNEYDETSNTSLDRSSPAVDSDLGYTVTEGTKTLAGYACYKWRGYEYRNEPCVDSIDNTAPLDRNGWERLPILSKDTLTEISSIALKNKEAIDSLQQKLVGNLTLAYDTIRKGMSPISFYGDGDCFISISRTNVQMEDRTVPAGIAIYQIKPNSTEFNGSCFLLNGQRMGFYKTEISSDGYQVDVPLLTYYNGNMGLAGSLAFGLDLNNWITTDQTSGSMYNNYLDGPNARIVLGNGAIELSAGYLLDNTFVNTPFIRIGNLSQSEDSLRAGIELAGYQIEGIMTQSFTASFGVKADTTNQPQIITDQDSITVETGSSVGSRQRIQHNITYTTYTVGNDQSYQIDNLNTFKIVHDFRGIQILENKTKLTNINNTYDDLYNKEFNVTILKPTLGDTVTAPNWPDTNTNKNFLLGWDLVHGHTANFTDMECQSLYCENLYIKELNATTAYKVATEWWTADQINSVIALLAPLIRDAQTTANKAYGAAKNHTHDETGRVASTSWAG